LAGGDYATASDGLQPLPEGDRTGAFDPLRPFACLGSWPSSSTPCRRWSRSWCCWSATSP